MFRLSSLPAALAHPLRHLHGLQPSAEGGPEGWAAFRLELARSRRFGHPVSLVRAPIQAGAAVPGRVSAIGRYVRVVDQGWSEGDQLYLVLPHASRSDAESLLARLVAEPGLRLSPGRARVVTFPDDGVTEEALIAALHSDAPTPIGVARQSGAVADESVSVRVGGR